MSVQIVRAAVIDVGVDQPSEDDEFVVDTNSWKELTYSRVRQPKPAYPSYIKKVLSAKGTLYSSGVCLVELAHAIEENELALVQKGATTPTRKEFRHGDDAGRRRVLEEITTSWAQVATMATLIDLRVDEPSTKRVMASLTAARVDGYDALLLEAMRSRGVFNVITDDGDFATVKDISMFTANPHVLRVARKQGMLKQRG